MAPRRPPVPRAGVRSAERAPDRGAERTAPGSRRPAPAARPRSTPAPVTRRPVLTLRGVLFTGVALVGLASVLGPGRAYVAQRSELGSLRADVAERQARVTDLAQQVDRWGDPAYVSAQARSRLHYVLPGETGYVVLDAPAASSQASVRPSGGATAGTAGPPTWRDRLGRSLGLDGADGGDGLLEPTGGATGTPAP